MDQTFDNFITDENSAPVVDYFRRLSVADTPTHSAISLRGPSGVGKTHLCKALAHNKKASYYTSEDIDSLLRIYLEQGLGSEHLIDMLSGGNIIIDDVDTLVSVTQITRINALHVETRGRVMKKIITNLIVQNAKLGKFVLLSDGVNMPDNSRVKKLGDEIIYYLDYPDRDARIAYCKQRLLQNHLCFSGDEIVRLVDSCGKTIPVVEGKIQTILAKKTVRGLAV